MCDAMFIILQVSLPSKVIVNKVKLGWESWRQLLLYHMLFFYMFPDTQREGCAGFLPVYKMVSMKSYTQDENLLCWFSENSILRDSS